MSRICLKMISISKDFRGFFRVNARDKFYTGGQLIENSITFLCGSIFRCIYIYIYRAWVLFIINMTINSTEGSLKIARSYILSPLLRFPPFISVST